MNINTEELILDFIENFKKIDKLALEALFSQGYCYYFALMLAERFCGKIYYLPVSCHFVVKIDDECFDIFGKYELIEPAYDWNTYEYFDSSDYKRVVQYCIHKLAD